MFEDQRVELLPARTTMSGMGHGRGRGRGNKTTNVAVNVALVFIKGDNNEVNIFQVAKAG